MKRNLRTVSGLSIVLAVLVMVSLTGVAQTLGSPERFTAVAINTTRGGTTSLEIAVDRWSTDAERDRLQSVLVKQGATKLLDVLQKTPKVGFIRETSSIGWDLHYARHAPMPEGGERVVVATDRPIGFWEASRQPRSIDYPFTIIELHVNKDGEGEGKLSFATKIITDKDSGSIVLENYGLQPVMLQGVKREK
jgi:hypothetical protein